MAQTFEPHWPMRSTCMVALMAIRLSFLAGQEGSLVKSTGMHFEAGLRFMNW